MYPPSIPRIKSDNNDNLDKYFVKLKLRGYLTSEKSYFYQFKMALFNNGNSEDFLLFVRNFNMTLEDSGILEPAANYQYLHTLVCGELLRHVDLLSDDVESAKPLRVEDIILVLGVYLFLLI